MEMTCQEFNMYVSEAAMMKVEEAAVLADVMLGGGKAVVKAIIERYGPPPTREAVEIEDFKRAVRARAWQGVQDMRRRTIIAVLLNGTEDEYVKGLLDTPSLSSARVEEIVKEMQETKARLRAQGKLPQ